MGHGVVFAAHLSTFPRLPIVVVGDNEVERVANIIYLSWLKLAALHFSASPYYGGR